MEKTNKGIWEKCGLIFNADNHNSWMKKRAFLPTPYLITKEIIRIYCAFLDDRNLGRIGYVDVKSSNPSEIISISKKPVLDIGEPGMFDDSGITPYCVVPYKDYLLMYYTGWQRLERAPYNMFTGVAVSKMNSDFFERISNVPLLERNTEEINLRTASFIMYEKPLWKIWYTSGSGYKNIKGKTLPFYGINYIESEDPLDFSRVEIYTCIKPEGEDIFGYTRPWVLKKRDTYLIWYSRRSISKIYEILFATSKDGIHWDEQENFLSLEISKQGWDSEMVGFPSIIETEYGTYMFYNGNGYGSTGFGYAKLNGNLDSLF